MSGVINYLPEDPGAAEATAVEILATIVRLKSPGAYPYRELRADVREALNYTREFGGSLEYRVWRDRLKGHVTKTGNYFEVRY